MTERWIYEVTTNGIRIANNILSDLAGNYGSKFHPEVKKAFSATLTSLLDLQSALCNHSYPEDAKAQTPNKIQKSGANSILPRQRSRN